MIVATQKIYFYHFYDGKKYYYTPNNYLKIKTRDDLRFYNGFFASITIGKESILVPSSEIFAEPRMKTNFMAIACSVIGILLMPNPEYILISFIYLFLAIRFNFLYKTSLKEANTFNRSM